ncbi:hypothetical protein LCGC14_1019730 [marine sediment metagenome]|uniref:Peptide deformylase n=1 Tax=marine sediment metagenome TaxID=412755 RepID=A0A0F9NJC3_9ZZZZ
MTEIITDIVRLRRKCYDVIPGDIDDIVAEMLETMKQTTECLGLAAPQIGYPLRMFVMKAVAFDASWDVIYLDEPPICIINPVVAFIRGTMTLMETCLSLPGLSVEVRRAREVKIKGLRADWSHREWMFGGLQARVALHELDHLSGKLMIDYQEVVDDPQAGN